MKLFFWRRKPQPEPNAPAAYATSTAMIERSQIPTRPLAVPIELRDALLRFALDCLVAGGARVRVEADDLISAVLPDGASVRYTTSLTRARAEDDTELLVQGGAALAMLLDDCAAHAAVASLHLQAHADPVEVARTQLAAPATGCGACTQSAGVALCQQCPLRANHINHIVLAGLPKHTAPRLVKQWMGRSIELTYIVVANDRHGRRDEEVRLAFDSATGTPLPLLTPATLADAQAIPLPNDCAALLQTTQTVAERALAPQLHATGALLRLMAEREYRARLDDIRTTSQRLLRESPETAPAIHAALEREVERLGDIYAVDVDARLTSVCFVERLMAALTIASQSGAPIELEADLATSALLPPICAACGTATRNALACANGHLLCPACQHHEASETSSASLACPICAGTTSISSRSSVGALPAAPAAEGSGSPLPAGRGAGGEDSLTLARLDAMSAASWRLFVIWLLEQDGYRIESGGATGLFEYWMCQPAGDGTPLLAGALRHPDQRALSTEDIERLAAQHAAHPAGSALLISTAIASNSAHAAARRLNVRLLDRAALAERLNDLVARHVHEREAITQHQQARAHAAASARAELLAALLKAEEGLAPADNARRAAGRSAVVAAATTLIDALASASRALLAWDTLMSDWTSAFDEREARDGSLLIRADAAAFAELAERADHLGTALAAPLGDTAGTPGVGDLGYTVWRRDILEQLSAQCEAYRWRVLAIDPSQWQSFAAARDLLAGERAAGAEATAAHAATRASRSYDQLARRARLEASTA